MIIDIIRAYNDRDSLYGNKLTNHLNMGLFSLYKMGASEERMHEFARGYRDYSQLPPVPPPQVSIDEGNFEQFCGIEGTYSSFIPYFSEIMNEENKEEVLKEYINRLIDGEAGGAFHGIIRLAYAVELDDLEELIKALAYMAEAYQPFPIEYSVEEVEPLPAVAHLAEDDHFRNFNFKRPLIIGRMTDIYEDEKFQRVVTDMPDRFYNNKTLSELLLQLYAMTEDFTVLHGFTSTHALRILEPYITDYDKALRRHWRLLQLAYLSTGCAAVKKLEIHSTNKSWDDIFKAACRSRDVHTLKLVYSLREQSELSGSDQLYRTVALKKTHFD